MGITDTDRLTDEKSEIAERVSVAARSWARADALDHRDPAGELELLFDVLNELNSRRLRIAELEAALQPFAAAVYRDNDDVTITHVDHGNYLRAKRLLTKG